ncbi:DMT family transporter [Chloroflexota bacterium]
MKSYLTMLAGVAAVSFAAVFIRLAEAPPMVIASCRMLIASLVILPLAFYKTPKLFGGLSRNEIMLILLSSLFLALHFGLWITSLEYTSIASSVVLVTAHPVFVAVISYFIWGERLNRLTAGGIAIALAGVVIINYNGMSLATQSLQGNLLALLAALAMGGYLIIGGKLKTRINLLSYLALVYSGAAVILLAATLIMGYSLSGYSGETYLMIVLLALVPQLVGHSLLNLAVRLVPVTIVSVAILGEPVGATLLGTIILGEVPTVNEIAGGLLILGGIFVVLRHSRGGLLQSGK